MINWQFLCTDRYKKTYGFAIIICFDTYDWIKQATEIWYYMGLLKEISKWMPMLFLCLF